MGMPDVTYECHEADTAYRIRPNPDAPPGEGYKHGAVMEWMDDPKDGWSGYFFIAPEAIEAMALAFNKAAEDLK